jgi:hypothetical protein
MHLVRLLGAMVLWGGVTGCGSIYHETRNELPPEPAAESRIRLDEARQACAAVQAAGVRLAQQLERGKPADVLSTGFDRLEVAVFDLERRVLAASDALTRSGGQDGATGELEEIRDAAAEWRAFVGTHRKSAQEDQLRHLQPLLGRSVGR